MGVHPKKVLFVTESSHLTSGYGVYAKNVLSRLHRNYGDICQVAELACYLNPAQPEGMSNPWRTYPNMPHPASQEENQAYHSNPHNEFGSWKFQPVLLDYKATEICLFRDYWYDEFTLLSHYRRFYNLYWMTTVDATPQMTKWLDGLRYLDGCLTYTEWGQEVLREAGNGKINLVGTAPPGGNYEDFKPLPKLDVKRSFGIPEDSLIVGFVGRNQVRKRFPELMNAFVKLLAEAPKIIKDRLFLYLHTDWPGLGWDIPTLLKQFGLSNKVYFTYGCEQCKYTFPSLFRESKGICDRCGQRTAKIIKSGDGCPDQTFNLIYNCMDVYVQYANAEGFGMPQVDAAAAGLPILTVDYAGMKDTVNLIGALPIKVAELSSVVEDGRMFAVPDEDDLNKKLLDLLLLPSAYRARIGYNHRLNAMKAFSWDKTAAKWADLIGRSKEKVAWNSGPDYIKPTFNPNIAARLNDANFVDYAHRTIFDGKGPPQFYLKHKIMKDLALGQITPETLMRQTIPCVRDNVVNELMQWVNDYNGQESLRCQAAGLIK